MRASALAGIIGCAVCVANVRAQPMPEAPTAPLGMDGPGGAKIPVTMSGSPESMGVEGSGRSAQPAPVALEGPIDPDKYICGAGDEFEINFWGQQNFRLQIAADLEGRAFISKVGYVEVAGKSLSEVRAQVRKKVKETYPGLKFDLVLVSPRKFVVHVVDYVKQPGSYSVTPLERISNVLVRAGITGSLRRIAISHKNGVRATADLLSYQLTGDTAFNPYMLDGDIISVPFPEVSVTIRGAVRRPGTYELTATKDLAEALQIAGGLSSQVARTLPLRIIKHNDKQQESFREVAYTDNGSPKTEPLDDGDTVIVHGVEDLQRSVLLIGQVEGADPLDITETSKRLPFVEGDTVLSLLERAGGPRTTGDLKRSYISRPQPKGPPKVIPLDLEALLVRRDFSVNQAVLLNDTIVIPQMHYSVLVEGAVGRSGVYNYNPLFGVREYIAHAGGITRTGLNLGEVRIVDSEGDTHKFSNNYKLAPGDTILVPERTFTRAEIAQVTLAAAGLLISAVAITLAATR